jgi:hypothetical protein
MKIETVNINIHSGESSIARAFLQAFLRDEGDHEASGETPSTTDTPALPALPALGVAFLCSTFAGLTTLPDGVHCAVFLLAVNCDGLSWQDAINWAKRLGGELPTRPVAALLFANVQPALSPRWHWTTDECDTSNAWTCDFYTGHQGYSLKSAKGSAVAVRLIPLDQFSS